MVLAADVYATQLTYRGHGRPLWVPEPCNSGEALVGDVGVVTEAGSFYRLFNATYPADHPVNGGRVPADYEPLVLPDHLVETIHNWLEPGALCSQSVRKVDVSAGGSADVATGHFSASYRFTCNESQGALLVLKDHADRRRIIENRIVPKYMNKHRRSWYMFATEVVGLEVKPDDIILVRGWVKTTQWAVAAFLDKGTAHEVAMEVGPGPYTNFNVSISVMNNISMSVEHRSGPIRPAGPDQMTTSVKDQCIFLETYRAKKRSFLSISFKMKASAEPTDDHRPSTPDYDVGAKSSPAESDESIICADPAIMSFCDPLENILDYILEHSDADIAIASQSCFESLHLLAGHEAHTHDIESLRRCLPGIDVDDDKVGTLQLADPSLVLREVDHTELVAGSELPVRPLPNTSGTHMNPATPPNPLVDEDPGHHQLIRDASILFLNERLNSASLTQRSELDTGAGNEKNTIHDSNAPASTHPQEPLPPESLNHSPPLPHIHDPFTPSLDSQSMSGSYSSQYASNALGRNVSASSDTNSYLDASPQYYSSSTVFTRRRNTPSLVISTDVVCSPHQSFLPVSGSHSPIDSPLSPPTSPVLNSYDSLPRTPASLHMGSHPLDDVQSHSPSASSYIHGLPTHPSPTKSHSPFMSPGLPRNSVSPVTARPTSFMSPPMPGPSVPITTVLEVAGRFPGFDNIVPQKTYRPDTQSDRRRYVEEVQLEAPILFFLQGPDGLGINCKDAMTSRFSRLVDRDDAMFENRGPSVSIRLNWPGYPPWSRQIPTRDFRSPPGPITRSKLAKNVAKTVQRFLDEKRGTAPEDDALPKWKLADITIDQLELIGLQQVSMGSWQAHLRLLPKP